MMSQEPTLESPEMRVRQYFDALRDGRIVDALDVFATDAIVRDADGSVHKGIRAIAASLARARGPLLVELVDLSREGDRVTAVVDIRTAKRGGGTRFREVFEIERRRVRSLSVTREVTAPGPPNPTAMQKSAPAGA